MDYDFSAIEKKWQKYWLENKTFKAQDCCPDKQKLYVLDMFPYPSGAGLHVGKDPCFHADCRRGGFR